MSLSISSVASAPADGLPDPGRFGQSLRDRWTGWWERRRPFPSARAYGEFLDYYEGLYQDRGPDPACFSRLLARNGPPFMANPFPDNTSEHYLYHPDGLVLADIEAVLADLAQGWATPGARKGRELGATPPLDPESAMAWPSLEQAQQGRRQAQRQVERKWAGQAGVCWGMVLVSAPSVGWVEARIHRDNLSWATVHALRTAPWQEWDVDPARVVRHALGHGVITHRVAQELFPDLVDPRSSISRNETDNEGLMP